MYAERCEVCIEVGSSPSLPSSAPHGIVLSVMTSNWLHCLLRAAENKHLRWHDVQHFHEPLSTRYDKSLGHHSTSEIAGHALE